VRVDLRKRQDAGIELLEIAGIYKQYRPELTDKLALKLAILNNPDLGELYTGYPVRRDALRQVKKFLQGGPFPQ
jgi:hypothetical protein